MIDAADLIEELCGKCGRWQILMTLLILASQFAVAWHPILMVIVQPPIKIICKENVTLNACSKECKEFEYDYSIWEKTVQMEWNLVCKREYLSSLIQTIVMLGILIGNVVFGYFADRFGRRIPLVVAVIMQIITGIAAAFAPCLPLYVILRFLSTVATGGTMIATFVLLLEFTAKKYLTIVGILFQLPFHLGHASLGLIGYLCRRWDYIQLIVSTPQILLVSYYCLLPESPRWLLTMKKTEKAIKLFEKIAKCNRRSTGNIREIVEKFVEESESTNQKSGGNAILLVRTKRSRLKFFLMAFNWFVVGLVFYAVAQYMGRIGGNIFLNISITGLVQVPCNFICIWIMARVGRKRSLIISFSLISLGMICIVFVTPEYPMYVTILGCLSMMGASMSLSIVYVYTGELLPTIVRNVGIGIISIACRIGSMLSPFVMLAEKYGHYYPPLILTINPIIGSILTAFLLPETNKLPLPDSVEQADVL